MSQEVSQEVSQMSQEVSQVHCSTDGVLYNFF